MNQRFLRFRALGLVGVVLTAYVLSDSLPAFARAEKPNQIVIRAEDVPDRGPAAPKVRPGRRRRPAAFVVKIMADPLTVQSPQASLTRLIVGPASRVAMHRHPRSAKILYLMKGRARVLGPPGSKPVKMVVGTAVFLPIGYPHVIENMGARPKPRFLQIFSPPGPEKVYRDPRNKNARARLRGDPLARPAEGRPTSRSPATLDRAAARSCPAGKGVARILLEEKTTGSPDHGAVGAGAGSGRGDTRGTRTPGPARSSTSSPDRGKVMVGGETHVVRPQHRHLLPGRSAPRRQDQRLGADPGGTDLRTGGTGAALPGRAPAGGGQARRPDGEQTVSRGKEGR